MINKLAFHRLIEKLPWRVSRGLIRRFPPAYAYFHVMNEHPLVVLIPEDFPDEQDLWNPFFDALRNVDVTFLCLIRGPLEASGDQGFDNTAKAFAEHKTRYPRHELTLLANNPLQLAEFSARRLPALSFNQNALIDERLFAVHPEIAKRFDAIYNARINPVKRHELAAKISSLALITIVDSRTDTGLFEKTVSTLDHATWLNFDSDKPALGDYHRIQQADLGKCLNQARSGLCLSRNEGAMFASIEYLLCGLPVVTTPSFGGRDVFYDDEYVATVDENPEAVAEGVREIVSRCVAPDYIRDRTMARITEHRLRLVEFIRGAAASKGVDLDRGKLYERTFPNQIYSLKKVHSILEYR